MALDSALSAPSECCKPTMLDDDAATQPWCRQQTRYNFKLPAQLASSYVSCAAHSTLPRLDEVESLDDSLWLQVPQALPLYAERHQLRSLIKSVVNLCNALPESGYMSCQNLHCHASALLHCCSCPNLPCSGSSS